MDRAQMDALDERIRKRVREAEEAGENATMACMPVEDGVTYFDDDVITECARCGVSIRCRPYVPEHWEKLCVDCLGAALAE